MSKTFQWGKKGLLSKKRTKKGRVIELLRTFSCYFNKKKDFCVKKGPKKDHFSSLVLKRTKSLIKDLYVSTASENQNQKPEVQMLFSQIKTGLLR